MIRLAPEGYAAFVMTLAPDAPNGKLEGKIKITTDDKAQPEIVIPVTGIIERK